MKNTISLIAITIILSWADGFSQNTNSYGRYSVGAGFGRQKVGFPMLELLAFPPHSSFWAEVCRDYTTDSDHPWYQTLGVYTFVNNSAGSGYQLESNIGKKIHLKGSLYLLPEIGFSLVHRFHPKQIFAQDGAQFNQLKDRGIIRPGVNFRCSVAYQTKAVMILLSYQLTTEFFYSESIPVLPVNYLHLGVRYKFNSQ